MKIEARHIMEAHVVSVGPNDPLSGVQRLFVEEEIHGAPVVDDDMHVVGVITSRDLLRAAADEHDSLRGDPGYFAELMESAGADWEAAPEGFIDRLEERCVQDYMSKQLISVTSETPVAQVAATLREHRVHRALVIDQGRLSGIVSAFDLIALLEKQQG